MGYRKLGFDVRKSDERKKWCNCNVNSMQVFIIHVHTKKYIASSQLALHGLYSLSHNRLPAGWTLTYVKTHKCYNEDSLGLYKLQLHQSPLASVNNACMVMVTSIWT